MVPTGFYASLFSATKLPPRSNRSNTVSRDLCFSECARIAWQLTNGRTPFQINKFLAWRSWPAWWRSWRQTSGDTNQSNSCWDSHHHELRFICQRNGEDCFIICMNTVHNLYKYFLGLFKSIKYDIFKVFIIAWRYHLRFYPKILFWTQVFWRLVLFFPSPERHQKTAWLSTENVLVFNFLSYVKYRILYLLRPIKLFLTSPLAVSIEGSRILARVIKHPKVVLNSCVTQFFKRAAFLIWHCLSLWSWPLLLSTTLKAKQKRVCE